MCLGIKMTLEIIEIVRWLNLFTSLIAFIYTSRLLCRYWVRRNKYVGKDRDTILLLVGTFAFFTLFSLGNLLVYMGSLLELSLISPMMMARSNTLFANIGLVLLTRYYSKVDDN